MDDSQARVADTPVLLGFVDADIRLAVRRAIVGAAARLARPACQGIFTDFTDQSGTSLSARLVASGKSPAEVFDQLQFVDDRGATQCDAGTTAGVHRNWLSAHSRLWTTVQLLPR
jgi:hypothetical protein